MTQPGEDDFGLSLLLDLDGEVFPMDNGYWTKFEAKIITPTSSIPHGVRYSLTLHQGNNKRILGYDNAHGFKPRNKRYAGNRLVWDHKHDRGQVEFYEFESAGALLEDFWNDVDRILDGE